MATLQLAQIGAPRTFTSYQLFTDLWTFFNKLSEIDAKWKQWTCREHYIENKILYDYMNLDRFLVYVI